MSENKTVQPEPPGGKLLLELAGQKPPPDFWDELKRRAKKWAKRWAIRVGGACALVGTNWISYLYGKGADLDWLVNGGSFVAIAVVAWAVLNRVK